MNNLTQKEQRAYQYILEQARKNGLPQWINGQKACEAGGYCVPANSSQVLWQLQNKSAVVYDKTHTHRGHHIVSIKNYQLTDKQQRVLGLLKEEANSKGLPMWVKSGSITVQAGYSPATVGSTVIKALAKNGHLEYDSVHNRDGVHITSIQSYGQLMSDKATKHIQRAVDNISIDKHKILELLADKANSTLTSAQIGASLGLQVDVNLVSHVVLKEVKQLIADGILDADIEPLKGITINAVNYKTKTMLLEEELKKYKAENKRLRARLFRHIKLYKPVIDSWVHSNGNDFAIVV